MVQRARRDQWDPPQLFQVRLDRQVRVGHRVQVDQRGQPAPCRGQAGVRVAQGGPVEMAALALLAQVVPVARLVSPVRSLVPRVHPGHPVPAGHLDRPGAQAELEARETKVIPDPREPPARLARAVLLVHQARPDPAVLPAEPEGRVESVVRAEPAELVALAQQVQLLGQLDRQAPADQVVPRVVRAGQGEQEALVASEPRALRPVPLDPVARQDHLDRAVLPAALAEREIKAPPGQQVHRDPVDPRGQVDRAAQRVELVAPEVQVQRERPAPFLDPRALRDRQGLLVLLARQVARAAPEAQEEPARRDPPALSQVQQVQVAQAGLLDRRAVQVGPEARAPQALPVQRRVQRVRLAPRVRPGRRVALAAPVEQVAPAALVVLEEQVE